MIIRNAAGLHCSPTRALQVTAAGDRCRQRTEALQKAGRLLDALREFHQAKINWFHGDTLYGTQRAMANIVDIHAELGMYLAAKKYALAVAALACGSADPSDRQLWQVPRANTLTTPGQGLGPGRQGPVRPPSWTCPTC
ncbi:MAG TPA: hypothetical protein VNF47_27995 [Streptosporangiaceae bacterium]|nr:hypothetical protein [Streptosporangiaceae bacterium]